MGVSTDGILAYGVDLGELDDIQLPWVGEDVDGGDEDGDFDSWYIGLHGLSSAPLWEQFNEWDCTEEAAAVPYPKRVQHYEELHPKWREALNDFYEKSRVLEQGAPIEIVNHCSGDYPMVIVAVPGTVTNASRGYPKTIESWDVDASKAEAAAAFCAEHSIPFENPSWILASYWG